MFHLVNHSIYPTNVPPLFTAKSSNTPFICPPYRFLIPRVSNKYNPSMEITCTTDVGLTHGCKSMRSTQKTRSATETNAKVTMLMDYARTYPNATIRYNASDMQLSVDSDTAYLVLHNARSQEAGHFYFSTNHTKSGTVTPSPPLNSSILTECVTWRNITTSATEAEPETLHHNSIAVVPLDST